MIEPVESIRHRIDMSFLHMEELLKSRNYQFEPLGIEASKAAAIIEDIPELHDRLIAATACYLDLPLITNDPVIRDSRFVNVLAKS